jgi:UDP-N-acetylmuramoyl-L-alanyl-D-glutamate--2,6-diaminopimelate ligase
MIKEILKIYSPKFFRNFYQRILNLIFNFFYYIKFKNPSKDLIVIGVTGTKGKSTTCYLIYKILNDLNIKTGICSSDFIGFGEKLEVNKTTNTMPGRGFLHIFLKEAKENNCKIAVLEATSEGLMFWRHKFIDFDFGVFLNIHPEHIERHGSFENYKKAKRKLFEAVAKSKKIKFLDGKRVEKTIIANLDDNQFHYFTNFKNLKIISFGIKSQAQIKPINYEISKEGIYFTLFGEKFFSPLLGFFNLYNILASICVPYSLNLLDIQKIKQTINSINGMPGKMDLIYDKDFKIMIDYAHTPDSITAVFETVKEMYNPKRILVLIGADGDRDKWKRPLFGEICAKYADVIVISEINSRNEDPLEIAKQIEKGAKNYIEKWNLKKDLLIILDRREAINWLVKNSKEGDLILSLVKGSEPFIVLKDKKIEWNEREEFLKAVENLKNKIN